MPFAFARSRVSSHTTCTQCGHYASGCKWALCSHSPLHYSRQAFIFCISLSANVHVLWCMNGVTDEEHTSTLILSNLGSHYLSPLTTIHLSAFGASASLNQIRQHPRPAKPHTRVLACFCRTKRWKIAPTNTAPTNRAPTLMQVHPLHSYLKCTFVTGARAYLCTQVSTLVVYWGSVSKCVLIHNWN